MGYYIVIQRIEADDPMQAAPWRVVAASEFPDLDTAETFLEAQPADSPGPGALAGELALLELDETDGTPGATLRATLTPGKGLERHGG